MAHDDAEYSAFVPGAALLFVEDGVEETADHVGDSRCYSYIWIVHSRSYCCSRRQIDVLHIVLVDPLQHVKAIPVS